MLKFKNLIGIFLFSLLLIPNVCTAFVLEGKNDDEITKLKEECVNLLKANSHIPEYLPGSGTREMITGVLRVLRGGTIKDYDDLYYKALDQRGLGIAAIHFANIFLFRNDAKHARKYIDLGRRFFIYSDQLFSDAAKVWENKIEKTAAEVRWVYNKAEFSLKALGRAYVPGPVLDGAFLAADFMLDRYMYGENVARENLKRNSALNAAADAIFSLPIPQLGGKSLQQVTDKGAGHLSGKMGKIVERIVSNPQTRKTILEALGRVGSQIPKEVVERTSEKALVKLKNSSKKEKGYAYKGFVSLKPSNNIQKKQPLGREKYPKKAMSHANLRRRGAYDTRGVQQSSRLKRLAEAYVNPGPPYVDQREYAQELISGYSRDIESNPGNPEYARYAWWAYFNRGQGYLQLGDYDRAIADFNRAIEIQPRDTWGYSVAWAYNNRAIAYACKGNIEKACSDARQACRLGSCEFLNFLQSKGYCKWR